MTKCVVRSGSVCFPLKSVCSFPPENRVCVLASAVKDTDTVTTASVQLYLHVWRLENHAVEVKFEKRGNIRSENPSRKRSLENMENLQEELGGSERRSSTSSVPGLCVELQVERIQFPLCPDPVTLLPPGPRNSFCVPK